jgi:predicted DNA-binding transcriptional regulator AlpA
MLEASDILTPRQLAERLQVKLSWVYESTRGRGRFGGTPLPVLKVGKYLRFSWQDIVEWLRTNRGK